MSDFSFNSMKKGRQTLTGSAFLILLFLVWMMVLPGCAASSAPELTITPQPGQIFEGKDVYGSFITYVPASVTQKPEIVVLIHGTPQKNDPEDFFAQLYAAVWKDFAEKNGFVLIAPAFNQADFSSRFGDRALGGYRGLFGREIGADAWVLRLVRAHQKTFGMEEAPFYLYGHSAGGQYTARFVVTHPTEVKAAVITSAATYPQPDPAIAWPFGMGELHTTITWDDGTSRKVDVVPDRETWLAAAQVSLTVIVGLNDTAELPLELIPGQKGRNRFVIGQNWVQDMQNFAQGAGVESRFKLAIIPGIGHSMSNLLPYSQAALLDE